MEGQDDQLGRWVNVVRKRCSQKRKASPVFEHPQLFAKLGEYVWVANLEVVATDVIVTPNSWQSIPFSRGGEGNAGRPRQLVVIEDSIIRRIDGVFCNWGLPQQPGRGCFSSC